MDQEKQFSSFKELVNDFPDWTFSEDALIYRGRRGGSLWSLIFEDQEREKHNVIARSKNGVVTIKEIVNV